MLLLIGPASAAAAIQVRVVGVNELLVTGDGEPDAAVFSVSGDGRIAVNGTPSPLPADGSVPISVELLGGPDTIDAAGLPAGTYQSLFADGGVDDDQITGGQTDGDVLFGGSGDDTLTGGKGGDEIFGGEDDDRMVWRNGDGTDDDEGGNGDDVVDVTGNPNPETYTFSRGERAEWALIARDADALNGAFSIELLSADLVVNGGAGNDRFEAIARAPATAPELAGLTHITVNAGEGNDTVIGGDGDDALFGDDDHDEILGGPGDDVVDGSIGNDDLSGNRGVDFVLGDAGNDLISWRDGDSDEEPLGGAGVDTLEVSVSDTEGDQLELNATALRRTNFAPFTLTLPAGAGSFDGLTVETGGGNDTFTASPGLGDLVVFVDGGAGADRLVGSDEDDNLTGGTGTDELLARGGEDSLTSRDGESDLVDGGAGTDRAQTDELTVDTVLDVERISAAPADDPPPPEPPMPPSPPSPPRPAADTAALLPRLGKTTVAKSGKRLVAKLTLSCPAEESGGCRTTLKLQTKALALGSKTLALGPGAQAKVMVRLSSRAARLVRGGRLPIRVTITSTDATGNTVTGTQAVVLKLPREKR